jgi:type II secretion system protein D
MNDDRKRSWPDLTRHGALLALAALAAPLPLSAQQPAPNSLRIGREAAPLQPTAQPRPMPAPADRLAPPPATQAMFQLASLSPEEFEGRLFSIWGHRAQATQDLATQTATFQLPAGASGETVVHIDRRAGQVRVAAPAPTSDAWLRLLKGIDARQVAGNQTAIIPVSKSDPRTIERTIALIKAAKDASVSPHQKRHIGQFVSMLFQPEGAQPPPPPDAGAQPPAEGPPGEAPAGGDPFSGIGNVRIEILDDQIIVIGKKEDVEKVLAIIEDIERQSLETLPEVEIYYLKHVDGTALNALITQVYTTAIGTRLGTVTVTPLVKPNALLIIGRKDAIPPMIELIMKLDKPIAPQTQIKVFNLKHMSAIDAERTVRNFFVDRPGETRNIRPGLDVQVQVIAEFRANALIVQASPRDMLEITRLVESLDVEGGTNAINELRIFKLTNSLAEQLAPALQEAITGTTAGGAQLQQQQQQQPQGGAGQGATSPAIATRRATALQFLRIDSNGEQILQSGILADMRITADTRGNSLIVVGPKSSMELMAALIRQLDELPSAVAELKVFTMVNGDATTLTQMLQELFATQQQGGQDQAGPLQTATGQGESSLVPLRFSVDQRTNSIIVSGNPGDLEVVRNVLYRLDASDLIQRITTVYRLHNAPAADVATAINNLLTRQRDLNQAAPELITAYQQIEREVLIEPETVTNSLIVSATPKYFEDIKRIVTELDRRPPRVVIQVLLAEVTLTDDDQFGVEWGLQDALLFDRGIVGGPRFNWLGSVPGNDNSAASLATREALAGQAISDLSLGRIDDVLGFGGMVLSASSESVNVLVRALEASSRAQIISRPQVQTLDNQTAYVNVGALVPRITGATTNQVGITNPTVQDISVGIILEVTPRTSPDGTIVMQINATKSEVGPEATGIPIFTDANGTVIRSPQIPITTAQTIVSAKSGQTIILGGLITTNQIETTRRIPYLGDIPVAGRLFRFDAVSQDRRELLLIMTPFVIQNEEQNEWLNQRESARMSWCLADIVNIHGPVGLDGNPEYNMTPSDVIYPDLDPTAPQNLPEGSEPTPATPPPPMPGLELPAPGTYGQLPTGVRAPVLSQTPPALMPQVIQQATRPAGTQALLPPGPEIPRPPQAPTPVQVQPQSPPPLQGLPARPEEQARFQPVMPPGGGQVAPAVWQQGVASGVVPAGYQQPLR